MTRINAPQPFNFNQATYMFNLTGGLVLLAAVLHATWNAMLHSNRDRMLSMTWMSIAIASVASIGVLRTGWPPTPCWPYLVLSGLVHVAYNLSLVRAYETGDLAQTYAIARGTSPLLVAVGGALFARDALGPLHVLGIVLISGGIIALATQGHQVSRRGALSAITTGATIALYTVIDGMGVRQSHGEALTYTAWMFLFYWLMPVLFIAKRGPASMWTGAMRDSKALLSSFAGGIVSIAAYGIVIWAMQSGAMGTVSALRETSVVFAMAIGRVFLRETVNARQWVASVIVASGAVCLGL